MPQGVGAEKCVSNFCGAGSFLRHECRAPHVGSRSSSKFGFKLSTRQTATASRRHEGYFAAMQKRCFSPRSRRRLATGTGEAMTRSPMLFSASTSNFPSARATKSTPSSRAA